MTHPGDTSPFGDFEGDFKVAPKAEAGASSDLIPEGVYKVACSAQDLTGDGKVVDHEIFTANSGTKGFKLFFEILEPETVEGPKSSEPVKVRGEIQEHVFWVTKKNLAFIKRDISTILGRDLKSLNELSTTAWAGLTCEVGIRHEVYRGFKQARVSFINAWKPEAEKAKEAGGKKASPAPAKEKAAAAAPSNVDF